MSIIHYDNSRFESQDFPFDMHVAQIHDNYPVHTHDFIEIVIILGGFASHRIDNRLYDIHAGDIYLLRGDVAHGFDNVNQLELCNIMFQPEKLLLTDFDLKQIEGFHSFFVFEPYFRKSHQFRNKLRLDFDRLARVRSYIDELEKEFKERKNGYRTRIILLLNDLIIYLSREYYRSGQEISGDICKLSRAVTYMENHYMQSISLEQLATIAHLSERQFTRIFKGSFGQTPVDFLIGLRIKKAMQLLVETDLPVNQIAYLVGFSDSNYFARAFKLRNRTTALEYRKIGRRGKEV